MTVHSRRACFAVTATKCRGEERGSFEDKIQKW